ncbi:MAG: hypothetical protein KDA89_24605, partial [Planctomycetaceae bacterium]|nr:hypothetical protein [Planctomycetaceae bacterium]
MMICGEKRNAGYRAGSQPGLHSYLRISPERITMREMPHRAAGSAAKPNAVKRFYSFNPQPQARLTA